MNKVYCKDCKYYEYWNETIYWTQFLFTKKTQVLARDSCSKKLDNYVGAETVTKHPSELNENNQCPYYEKGTPLRKPDTRSQMYE